MGIPRFILILFILIAGVYLSPGTARADSVSSPSGPVLLLGVATTGSAVVNMIAMATRHPGYGMGATGAVLGVTSLAAAGSMDDGRTGLLAIGGVAVAMGLLACWDRHALDKQTRERVALLPTWERRDGENIMGAALRVRF